MKFFNILISLHFKILKFYRSLSFFQFSFQINKIQLILYVGKPMTIFLGEELCSPSVLNSNNIFSLCTTIHGRKGSSRVSVAYKRASFETARIAMNEKQYASLVFFIFD